MKWIYSELSLKFIGYFPDYLFTLSGTLLGFFWATFVETAVHETQRWSYLRLGTKKQNQKKKT